MWELKQIKEEADENGFRKCEVECEFGKAVLLLLKKDG